MKLSVKQIDRLFWAMWSELIGWIACCWLDVPLCGYIHAHTLMDGLCRSHGGGDGHYYYIPDVVIPEGEIAL